MKIIHIHGAAKIDARAGRANGGLVLSGKVLDDAGLPITGQALQVQIERGAGSQSVHFEPGTMPTGCGPKPVAFAVEGDGQMALVPLDEAGRFCVQVALPVDRYVAHIASQATPLLDPAKVDVALDLARHSLALRFDGEPRIVSLDAAEIALDAVATTDDDGAATAGSDLFLTLTDDRGAQLGSATTNVSGHARFTLDPAKLGPPGPGELRLAFAGDHDTSAGSHVASIERHTRVALSLAEASRGGSPEDGIAIDVHATSHAGDAPSGTIEARLGDIAVGAAPVERGQAHLTATFVAPAAPSALLTLRYLPDTPWFEEGEPLTVVVPVRPPSALHQMPIVFMGLAVLAFLVLGRLGRKRPPAPVAKKPIDILPIGPRVEVVRASADPDAGWTGRVVDAHEGSVIAEARVVIERAGFEGVAVVASTFTDREGRFTLPPTDASAAGGEPRLVIEAPLHSALHKKLPPSGELEIALVSRKRKVLERLVEWA
ncbi:MAG: hypothetical protein JWM74_1594, partial [Myxococcaceae bacterium]|nr:hypothetical protein [Myxococcaceae bacterium]